MNKQIGYFVGVVVVLLGAMMATLPYLVQHIKLGLEFQGGYEIVYQALPRTPGRPVNHASVVQAANLLAERASKFGISEPSVNILGNDLIRVEMAGVSAGDPVVAQLKNPEGLPVSLQEKYSETVGGVLGAGDLHDTLVAGLIALGAIFAFLVTAYRGKGMIASFTTMVTLWLLLAAFVALGATLSLAAIVAFVLAIGIASDANIIALERAREEFVPGQTAGSALAQGAHKAFRTIADANASVLICASILLAVGIGPIRGFALTTILSIFFSFAANVLLARFLMELRYGQDRGARLFWRKLNSSSHAKKRTALSFTRFSKFAILGGGLVLFAGIYSMGTAPLNFDIEFKAGTALDVYIDTPITQDDAAQLIEKSGIHPATVTVGGKNQTAIAARFDDVLDTEQVNTIVDQFKQSYPSVTFAENTADPAVAKSLAQQSVTVVLLALLGTALFIALRFNWRVALASIVSVISAVLFVMSCFALFHLEIDITLIAALLIVIGYALNETVVVFDRIREHTPEGWINRDEMVNVSIQQVVRRSLSTILTVLAGAASLYLFGAEPLQTFSLAIFLGLLWGAFASLFIAPRIWLALSGKSLLAAPVTAQ